MQTKIKTHALAIRGARDAIIWNNSVDPRLATQLRPIIGERCAHAMPRKKKKKMRNGCLKLPVVYVKYVTDATVGVDNFEEFDEIVITRCGSRVLFCTEPL